LAISLAYTKRIKERERKWMSEGSEVTLATYLFVQPQIDKETVHIGFEYIGAHKMFQAKSRQFLASDKLVFIVDVPSRIFFHFFGEIFQERGPGRSRTQLRNIISAHLYPFIRSKQKPTVAHHAHVVDVRFRFDGSEVFTRSTIPYLDDLFVRHNHLVATAVFGIAMPRS
jgi:hypothetical protein